MIDDTQTQEADGSVRAELERAFADAASKASDDPASKPDTTPAESTPNPDVAGDSKQPEAAKKPDKASTPEPGKRIDPPARWTKEEKEAWEKMTEGLDEQGAAAVQKIQSILMARNRSMEGEFTKQFQAIAADRAYKAEIDKVIAPYRDQWKAAGLSETAALKELLDGFQYSNRDPLGFIQWVANLRGIDLRRAFGGQPQQHQQQHGGDDDNVQLHPTVQRMLDDANSKVEAMQRHINALSQGQQQINHQWTAAQQAEYQRVQSQVANELHAFESATDESGAAKYPFYNDVRQHMSQLLTAGMADTLEDAYDQAIHMRPDIRQRVIESRELSARREWERKLQEDAKKARGAAGSLVPGGPSVTPINNGETPRPSSVREALEAAVTAQLGRGRA